MERSEADCEVPTVEVLREEIVQGNISKDEKKERRRGSGEEEEGTSDWCEKGSRSILNQWNYCSTWCGCHCRLSISRPIVKGHPVRMIALTAVTPTP